MQNTSNSKVFHFRKHPKRNDSYSYHYSSKRYVLIMTWKLWAMLAVGIAAVIVCLVAIIRLHNYEKKLHSQIKTYQNGR